MKQIILASSSIRRRELLEKTGLEFIVVSADIDETPKSDEQAEDLVKRLSKEKAEKIALRYSEAIIIAADTEVVLENEIFGKPKDEHHAKEMLAKLSGKTHQVITGFTILDTQTNKQTTEMVKTFVTFKKIDERQIAEYVATKKTL